MTEQTTIHPVVTLMLQRMDSHPEEFFTGSGHNWMNRISSYKQYFTAEETAMLEAKVAQIFKDKFHSEVMARLLNGEEEDRKKNEAQKAKMVQTGQLGGVLTPANPYGNYPQQWHDTDEYNSLMQQMQQSKRELEMEKAKLLGTLGKPKKYFSW